MKGYRFYEELEHKNRKGERSRGTVVAVLLDGNNRPYYFQSSGSWCSDAIASLFDEPNSSVCSTSVGMTYLSGCCRRVSEKVAREIHPSLFEYLGG